MARPAVALAALLAATLLAAGCGDDSPAYAPCGGSDGCKGKQSDGCYRILLTRTDGSEGDGKLCTLECESDADCPDGGACLAFDADAERTFLCYERCEEPGDCYQGFRCTTVEAPDATDRVCLP